MRGQYVTPYVTFACRVDGREHVCAKDMVLALAVSKLVSNGGALKVIAPADPRAAIARLCAEKGYTLTTLERVLPTLEDAFLSLVGAEA